MKNTRIKKVKVSRLSARLNQPFRIATGQHDSLENILFSIELENGTHGFGEAAIATHITGETLETTIQNLNCIGEALIGRDASDYLRISAEFNERLVNNRASLAALEMALLDGLTRELRIPLWRFFGASCRPLKTDITIVIGGLEEAETTTAAYYRRGFRTFKIKIGKDPDLDLKRILAVARIAKRSALILDANQGYSVKEILQFLKELSRAGIKPALIEQPVPKNDYEGLAKISREGRILVCADESASSLQDAARIIRNKICGAINIKLMKSGVLEAREIARLAQTFGIKLMIGAMMESELSSTCSAHLAAGMGGFDFIDLDTPYFLKEKIMKGFAPSVSGTYDLKKIKAGIGVTPAREA